MQEINLLPTEIINEIAAGEVIERPVAVVKELIENSIDARASKITISIEEGGISKIVVSDNGIGIEQKYIKTSVGRHTTSKLNMRTLNNIITLGFRGEALYSISNASEFTMISRTKDSTEAFELKVIYGKPLSIKPSKGNVGTIIKVENIFRNLPVRKKFLKSENSESLAIRNFIKKISLAYPHISFFLVEDKKAKLELVGRINNEKLKKRVLEIYGKDFYKSSLYIEKKFENFNIKMFVSIPTFNKSNWNSTTIIINGRIIKDKLLLGVFKAAYSGLLAGNRFPVVLLYLNIDSNNLDINVHPAKSEVRILNRNIINSFIIKIIKSKLQETGLKFSVEAEKYLISKMKTNIQANFNENLINKKENLFQYEKIEKNNDNAENKVNKIQTYTNQLGYAKAQINNMFIVSQTNDSLILIDQHAAHERIVLENLKKNYKKRKILKQVLLLPEIVNIDEDKLLLIKNKKAISELGFEFDDYGENSIIVREIPAILGKINIDSLFQDLKEQINVLGEINPEDSGIERILSSIACHNSVRAGKKLNIEEMNSILRLMEKTPNSSQCNHGRPTVVELRLRDVEALFGRT